MNALLVVKTANGYAVLPCSEPIPQGDISRMHVAGKLTGNYYSKREQTVSEILAAHFEPETEVE